MARAGGEFDQRDGRSATPVYDQMIAEFGDPYIPPIALSIPPFYPDRDRYSSGGQASAYLPIPQQQWGEPARQW